MHGWFKVFSIRFGIIPVPIFLHITRTGRNPIRGDPKISVRVFSIPLPSKFIQINLEQKKILKKGKNATSP